MYWHDMCLTVEPQPLLHTLPLHSSEGQAAAETKSVLHLRCGARARSHKSEWILTRYLHCAFGHWPSNVVPL